MFSRLHALTLLFRRLQRLHYAQQFGLDLGECEILGIVQILGRSSCKQICQVGDLDKAQVSRLVKRLTRQGLLVRSVHPKLQRTVNVALTERGEAVARVLRTATLKLNRESLSTVPDAERAVFAAVTSTLTEKVRRMLHKQRNGAGR